MNWWILCIVFLQPFSEWLLCRVTSSKTSPTAGLLVAEESFPWWWRPISSSFVCLFVLTLDPGHYLFMNGILEFFIFGLLGYLGYVPGVLVQRRMPKNVAQKCRIIVFGHATGFPPIHPSMEWRIWGILPQTSYQLRKRIREDCWVNDPSFIQIVRFIRDVWGLRNTNEFSLLPVSFKKKADPRWDSRILVKRQPSPRWPWHDFWGSLGTLRWKSN